MRIRVGWIYVLVLALFAGLSNAALAQGLNASVSGTITDPQGGVIPGVTVTVTNIGTSLSKTVKSDDSGYYAVSDLNPGTYNIVVSAPGFATKKVNSVILAVAQVSRQDVSLTLGGTNEVVNVE